MNSLNNNLKFIININKRFLKRNRLFSMQRIMFYPNFNFSLFLLMMQAFLVDVIVPL